MRRIAIIVLALAASACTPTQWVKQDAAPEQAGRDEAECRHWAWREASTRTFYRQRMGPVIVPGQVIWPSGAFVDPYAHQALEEHSLAQRCMELKGYKLAPAPSK